MTEIKFDKFEQQVFLNTVLIENLTDGEVGTGFLVLKSAGEEGRQKFLLFSNKHVFWGKKDSNTAGLVKKVRFTLHKNNEEGTYVLGNTTKVEGVIRRNPEHGYYDHPDEDVDVACANISLLNERGLSLNIIGLGTDFFDGSIEDLYAGQQIFFVGYPSGFYDETNKLPVMRSGTIASIPSVNFNGKPQILLDAQVFPGSSGSPVFANVNGRYMLLGLISSGLAKNLDFMKLESTSNSSSPSPLIPKEWIGLGLLFTSETVKTVYDLA